MAAYPWAQGLAGVQTPLGIGEQVHFAAKPPTGPGHLTGSWILALTCPEREEQEETILLRVLRTLSQILTSWMENSERVQVRSIIWGQVSPKSSGSFSNIWNHPSLIHIMETVLVRDLMGLPGSLRLLGPWLKYQPRGGCVNLGAI